MIKTENLTFSYEDSTDLVLDNINEYRKRLVYRDFRP